MYLIFNRINGFVGVQNRKAEHPVLTWTANGLNKKLVLQVQLRCGWLVGFVALHPKSTAMAIAGRSVHLTTLFPGQA